MGGGGGAATPPAQRSQSRARLPSVSAVRRYTLWNSSPLSPNASGFWLGLERGQSFLCLPYFAAFFCLVFFSFFLAFSSRLGGEASGRVRNAVSVLRSKPPAPCSFPPCTPAVRRYASDELGLRLSQKGLTPLHSDTPVPGEFKTEEDVFRRLGLDYVPPHLRWA